MKAKNYAEFKYRKPNGNESDRKVFVISSPSDCYFTIDLSEFDEDERAYYLRELDFLFNVVVQEGIEELGLTNNYRNFKKERIIQS